MKSKLIFFLLFIQCSFMSAQTLTINTAEVCAGQEVLLPVISSSVLNVGALTLFIGFDTTNLTFISIDNLNPQLDGMSSNLMTAPSQLAFAWSSTTPINLQNDTLFTIKFLTNGQSAPVYCNPGCEFSNPSGVLIPVFFANGSVNNGLPVISVQPADTSILEGGHAFFSVFSQNAISYFWRESQDQGASWLTLEDDGIYSGTHSKELSISPVPLSFNKNQYQCVFTRENCMAQSAPAILSVDALTSTKNNIGRDIKDLVISPVPFSNHINLDFTMPENGSFAIQALSCLGQLVTEINQPSQVLGHHHILLNTSDWRPGIYFIKLTLTCLNEKSYQIVKITKNQ